MAYAETNEDRVYAQDQKRIKSYRSELQGISAGMAMLIEAIEIGRHDDALSLARSIQAKADERLKTP